MSIEIEPERTRRAFFRDLADRVGIISIVLSTLGRSGFPFQDNPNAVIATAKISDHPELQKVGGFLLLRDTPAGELLIVYAGEGQFNAMSNVCPHKHCHVEVKSPTVIKCPCHGSTYRIDGTYVKGPSKQSLKKFPTIVESGIISVNAN